MTLIDRDELMKFPIRMDHYDKEHGNEHFVSGIETALEYAMYLPIVDAVPVVRCGQCADYQFSEADHTYICNHFYGTAHPLVCPSRNDFCSHGRLPYYC